MYLVHGPRFVDRLRQAFEQSLEVGHAFAEQSDLVALRTPASSSRTTRSTSSSNRYRPSRVAMDQTCTPSAGPPGTPTPRRPERLNAGAPPQARQITMRSISSTVTLSAVRS